MQESIKLLVKQVVFDKVFLGSIIALLVVSIIFTIVLSIGIQPSELQVSVQYTAYGDAHFYRGSWINLITFALFGVITAILNTAVAVKLFIEKGRAFGIVYAVATALVLVLSGSLLFRIISIAALS